MKKTLRSKIALTLSALMLTGGVLTGCQKTDETQSTTAAGTKAPAANAETTAPVPAELGEGMDGWQPFAERVHITVPVYDRSKEGYPAVDDNYWTRWIQSEFGEKYNIDVEYVAIPRGDVMTKYNLLIVGGETPTIMMEYDYPKVAQWANEGAMTTIDINEFAKVAPTFYQAMVDNNQLGYTDLGGETYFVLTERPYYDTEFTYADFYRLDWVKQLGMEPPTDYKSYSAIIDAIIEAKICPIPPVGLGLPNNAYMANFGYRDFPVNEEDWIKHSSLGTAGLTWYAGEKMLKRLNEEYAKGWYSSEFDLDANDGGAGTATQMQTDFVNGQSFRYGGYYAANVPWLSAFYENNPDAELGVLNPNWMKEEGYAPGAIRATNPFGMIVGFSSLATDDQLKAAWMLMEWMIQEENLFVLENGVEGVTYTIGADGLPVVDGEYRGEEMLNHNMNIDMTCLVHASKKSGTVEQTIASLSPQGLPQDFTQDLINNYYELKKIADKGMAYSDPVFAVAIESETEYTAPLLSLYKEYYVKLVKCAPAEFDALFADLSQQYLDAGYQEVIDERLAAYNAGNTTKLPK